MTDCPTPEYIDRYRRGALDTLQDVRALETHLLTCEKCRQTLREQVSYAAPGLAAQLLPTQAETLHLDSALVMQYVRGILSPPDLEIVESHLECCPRCATDVAELETFHRQMQQFDFVQLEKSVAHPHIWERCASFCFSSGQSFNNSIHRLFAWWHSLSINGRLVFALIAGVIAGLLLKDHAQDLQIVGSLFLGVLEKLAMLYIFVAIIHTLLRTEVTGRTARRLAYLALTNTLVAVSIGLLVGNIAQPGRHWPLVVNGQGADFLRKVIQQPSVTVLESLLNNTLLFVVLLALASGVTLRMTRQEQLLHSKRDYLVVESFLATIYRSLTLMLNGIVLLFPLAVFAVIAAQVGRFQWHTFAALLGFSLTVLCALSLQVSFYLLRLWFRAAMPPLEFLRGAREALFTAFTTASSAVTLPLTYRNLRDNVKVRERAAGLGVLVGGQFSRDGTALFEAITPIFIAQALGRPLDFSQQMLVFLMAIIASIAAPGLPNTGLITMVLVFRSVDLPTQYILLLPAVDWFLDRCRTMVNVLGTMTMTYLLDRRTAKDDPRASATDVSDAEVLEPEIVETEVVTQGEPDHVP